MPCPDSVRSACRVMSRCCYFLLFLSPQITQISADIFSPQITQIFADEKIIKLLIRANPRESAFQKIIIRVICGEWKIIRSVRTTCSSP